MIGDEVEISVLAVMGDKVRLGIAAPRSIPVFRKEVWVEIQESGPAPDSRLAVEAELQRLKTSDPE